MPILDPLDWLRMGTLDGARVLGLDDRIGSLEEGKEADLIALDPTFVSALPGAPADDEPDRPHEQAHLPRASGHGPRRLGSRSAAGGPRAPDMTERASGCQGSGGLPDDAGRWIVTTFGPDESIDAVETLPGATSSAVFRVTIRGGDHSNRRLVLRWYSKARAAHREPEAVPREVAALRTLAGTGVPAPAMVAALDGGGTAAAGVLMSELPGMPLFDVPDPGAIRDLLAAIHAIDPAPMARFRYHGYHEDARLDPPVVVAGPASLGASRHADIDGPPERPGPIHPPRFPSGQPPLV